MIDQLGAGTLTVTQPTSRTEGIEPATASAAAILSQLNEMVQEQQQQVNRNTAAYLSGDLLATADPSRIQSEKVRYNLNEYHSL